MKQGWEIKKLGEICDIVGGSTPKTGEPSYWDGEHYWITPAELDGSKYISSTSRTITDEGVKSAHLQLLPSGTVLLSSRAPIGKVAITTAPMYCNQGFKNLVCSDKLYNEFAYWFLFHNTDYLNSLGTGATFKEISKRVVEQIPISIPPREEQERIVEELDCLSGVIEKKREQLKELDALAQSIFYQMFGDPITNEKGWEVKKMGEIVQSNMIGLTRSGAEQGESKQYLYFKMNNISNKGGVDFSKLTRVDASNSEIEKYSLSYGDFLFNTRNSFDLVGKSCVYNVRYGEIMVFNNNIMRIVFNQNVSTIYMAYLFQNRYISEQLDKIKKGTTSVWAIYYKDLEHILVNIPPFALQQEFADKIEAIEKQKELIKQSITQTEELFNSRMDYYFN